MWIFVVLSFPAANVTSASCVRLYSSSGIAGCADISWIIWSANAFETKAALLKRERETEIKVSRVMKFAWNVRRSATRERKGDRNNLLNASRHDTEMMLMMMTFHSRRLFLVRSRPFFIALSPWPTFSIYPRVGRRPSDSKKKHFFRILFSAKCLSYTRANPINKRTKTERREIASFDRTHVDLRLSENATRARARVCLFVWTNRRNADARSVPLRHRDSLAYRCAARIYSRNGAHSRTKNSDASKVFGPAVLDPQRKWMKELEGG